MPIGKVSVVITGARDRYYRAKNPGPMLKYFESYARNAWDYAISAWLEAVVEKVVVDTGMSAGSTLPLARKLHMRTVILQAIRGNAKGPMVPKPGHKGAGKYGFADNDGPLKSLPFGEKIGKSAYKVAYGNRSRLVLRFTFTIRILQWAIHEDNYDTWQATVGSIDVFQSALDEALSRMTPHKVLNEYITKGKLPVATTNRFRG